MKKPWVEFAFIAFLLWLYGGDFVWRVRLSSSAAAVLNPLPPLALSLVGAVVSLGLAVSLALHLTKPAFARAHSLALASACAVLFIDFAVISSRRTPAMPEERIAMSVQAFADEASSFTTGDGVPVDRRGLGELAAKIGAPPLFKDGAQVEHWSVELREGCRGPATEAGTSSAGTLLYCRSSDGRKAWVSAVAVPLGTRFGAAGVISVEGLFAGEVGLVPPSPDEPSQGPHEGAVWGAPTPDGSP